MSRPVPITILYEDIQQGCFLRHVLTNRGWTKHDLRERRFPGGGSAAQWVREQFPSELAFYRSRHTRWALIAVIDADMEAVSDREREFDEACREKNIAKREPNEAVLWVIPRRNIETWIAYLQGEPVDEVIEYPKFKGRESRCHPLVDKLDEMCKAGKLRGSPPPSLEHCCAQFQSFWSLMQ